MTIYLVTKFPATDNRAIFVLISPMSISLHDMNFKFSLDTSKFVNLSSNFLEFGPEMRSRQYYRLYL